ncbi:hypothetical protein MycrhDRAFT_6665 [Mycolicibacterium rhodesiae JS60]|nr:hypothetical protein MycrhDRAFT_6665 [Mycolicibacterium rhodesiae JS60]
MASIWDETNESAQEPVATKGSREPVGFQGSVDARSAEIRNESASAAAAARGRDERLATIRYHADGQLRRAGLQAASVLTDRGVPTQALTVTKYGGRKPRPRNVATGWYLGKYTSVINDDRGYYESEDHRYFLHSDGRLAPFNGHRRTSPTPGESIEIWNELLRFEASYKVMIDSIDIFFTDASGVLRFGGLINDPSTLLVGEFAFNEADASLYFNADYFNNRPFEARMLQIDHLLIELVAQKLAS